MALSGATRRQLRSGTCGFFRQWIRPRYFTILLGMLSPASCLYALAAMQLAYERVCASPCPPTHIHPFADRSIYEIGNLLTKKNNHYNTSTRVPGYPESLAGQSPGRGIGPSAPMTAPSAPPPYLPRLRSPTLVWHDNYFVGS